jgi:hypothetical protein
MNRIKSLLGVFAFSLLVLSLPMVASAQWGGGNNRDRNRDRDRDDDYYGRDRDDDRYGRQNGYYNYSRLRDTVRRLERDSNDFVKFVDRALDRSRYDDSRREDQLNNLVKDFRRAADRLEDRFDSRNLYRSQSEAQQVINLGNQIDRSLRRYRLGWDVENYWYNNLKNQVREIENAYRYNNRGNNRNRDWRDIFRF